MSEPPFSKLPPGHVRFILVGTSHPANVGAAARAAKVMGFDDLVLVAPSSPGLHRHPQALALASGATDVLEGVREFDALPEALEGLTHLCATAMTPRDFGPPTMAPRAHLPEVAAQGHRLGLVFGSERFGMRNEDVYRCHACLSIPTAPGYGSLNLAQAVQLLAYEWRQALGSFEVRERTAAANWASAAQVQGLLAHWQRALVAIGFLDPEQPRKLMPRLNQLLNRSQITEPELHILHGVARETLRASQGGPGSGRALARAPSQPPSGMEDAQGNAE
jgi:tRNA/rRNA methyltransferase